MCNYPGCYRVIPQMKDVSGKQQACPARWTQTPPLSRIKKDKKKQQSHTKPGCLPLSRHPRVCRFPFVLHFGLTALNFELYQQSKKKKGQRENWSVWCLFVCFPFPEGWFCFHKSIKNSEFKGCFCGKEFMSKSPLSIPLSCPEEERFLLRKDMDKLTLSHSFIFLLLCLCTSAASDTLPALCFWTMPVQFPRAQRSSTALSA